MSAKVNHNPLGNSRYLFQNLTEAQEFFDSLNIDSANLSTEGVVKQSQSISYSPFNSYTNTDKVTVTVDATPYDVPLVACHNETRTKLLALNTAFQDLLTKLIAAGIISAN